QDVAVRDAEPLGGGARDLDPAVPGDLRDGVRRLLEPRAARAASVVPAERRIGQEREAARIPVELRGRDRDRRLQGGDGARGAGPPDPTALERRTPARGADQRLRSEERRGGKGWTAPRTGDRHE